MFPSLVVEETRLGLQGVNLYGLQQITCFPGTAALSVCDHSVLPSGLVFALDHHWDQYVPKKEVDFNCFSYSHPAAAASHM